MAVKQINYDDKSFAINYEIVNNTCEKTIVFLHGWGSNKEVMKSSFSSFLKEYRHIYIDMPGFGKSENDYVLTTNDYAKIIELFLKQIMPDETFLTAIAGHSFGGKVATLLNPRNLILLSSAGILEEKSSKVKFKMPVNYTIGCSNGCFITNYIRRPKYEKRLDECYCNNCKESTLVFKILKRGVK